MKYKVGEKVRFRKGFDCDYKKLNYGGSGYADPDRLEESGIRYLTISEAQPGSERGLFSVEPIYFFDNWTNGVFEFAIISLSEIRNRKIECLIG